MCLHARKLWLRSHQQLDHCLHYDASGGLLQHAAFRMPQLSACVTQVYQSGLRSHLQAESSLQGAGSGCRQSLPGLRCPGTGWQGILQSPAYCATSCASSFEGHGICARFHAGRVSLQAAPIQQQPAGKCSGSPDSQIDRETLLAGKCQSACTGSSDVSD